MGEFSYFCRCFCPILSWSPKPTLSNFSYSGRRPEIPALAGGKGRKSVSRQVQHRWRRYHRWICNRMHSCFQMKASRMASASPTDTPLSSLTRTSQMESVSLTGTPFFLGRVCGQSEHGTLFCCRGWQVHVDNHNDTVILRATSLMECIVDR